MFLRRLLLEKDGLVLREIVFRKGVNLIIDATSDREKRSSGNNVGKTTTLRLIDYCLGGDGKNIYTDPEFKNKTNSTVESFLRDNNVVVTLTLVNHFDSPASDELTIRRNFLKDRKNTLLEIDGVTVSKTSMQSVLKKKIFKNESNKPTFRQIISKNIRDDKLRLSNTVKVLHPTSKAEEYEALYLFWFGISIDTAARKQQLLSKKSIEDTLQKRLKKDSSLSQITQSHLLIIDEIENLENKKSEFNINENYDTELNELNEIKSDINRLTTLSARLSLRKSLIEESIEELNSEFADIDSEKIKGLYLEAKSLIPNLQKTFEETLEFHNGMINEKKKFISSDLPGINNKLQEINHLLESALYKEKYLSGSLIKSGKMEDLQGVISSLNIAYEKKGSLEEQKRLWEKSNQVLEDINTELKDIDDGIYSLDEKLQAKVAIFNKFFAALSEELYGEKFVLSADKNEKGYELNITSLFSNPGTGRKKGEMASFDLAYIQFADFTNINCLHFVLQDQIENTHDNQISSLFTDIIGNINCQYILSVLKDKLPSDINVADYEILTLSQKNKLFKI